MAFVVFQDLLREVLETLVKERLDPIAYSG